MFTQASISEVTCAVTMTKLNEFFLHTLVCFILLFKNHGWTRVWESLAIFGRGLEFLWPQSMSHSLNI